MARTLSAAKTAMTAKATKPSSCKRSTAYKQGERSKQTRAFKAQLESAMAKVELVKGQLEAAEAETMAARAAEKNKEEEKREKEKNEKKVLQEAGVQTDEPPVQSWDSFRRRFDWIVKELNQEHKMLWACQALLRKHGIPCPR